MRTLALAAAAATACDCDGKYKAYPYPIFAWKKVTCGESRQPLCTDGITVPKTVGKCLTPSEGFTVIFVTSLSNLGEVKKNAFAMEGDVNTAKWGKVGKYYFKFRDILKYDAGRLKLTGKCSGRRYLTRKDYADCMAECPDGQEKPVTLVTYVVLRHTGQGQERRFTKRATVDCNADKEMTATHLLEAMRDHEAINQFLINASRFKLVIAPSTAPGPLRKPASDEAFNGDWSDDEKIVPSDDDTATIASPPTTASELVERENEKNAAAVAATTCCHSGCAARASLDARVLSYINVVALSALLKATTPDQKDADDEQLRTVTIC